MKLFSVTPQCASEVSDALWSAGYVIKPVHCGLVVYNPDNFGVRYPESLVSTPYLFRPEYSIKHLHGRVSDGSPVQVRLARDLRVAAAIVDFCVYPPASPIERLVSPPRRQTVSKIVSVEKAPCDDIESLHGYAAGVAIFRELTGRTDTADDKAAAMLRRQAENCLELQELEDMYRAE